MHMPYQQTTNQLSHRGTDSAFLIGRNVALCDAVPRWIGKEQTMSGSTDQLKGKGNELKGKLKQDIGIDTDNPDLVAEGQEMRRRARRSRSSAPSRMLCATSRIPSSGSTVTGKGPKSQTTKDTKKRDDFACSFFLVLLGNLVVLNRCLGRFPRGDVTSARHHPA